MCVQSLVEEIMFNAGHLLTAEPPQEESEDQPEAPRLPLEKKRGRGFCHALTKLYIHEAGGYAQVRVSKGPAWTTLTSLSENSFCSLTFLKL